MKIKILLIVSVAFAMTARAQNSDLDKLEYTVRTMQQTITGLQKEIADLKKAQTNQTYQVNQTNASVPMQTGKAVEFTVPTITTETGESQVVAHESLRDDQEAA